MAAGYRMDALAEAVSEAAGGGLRARLLGGDASRVIDAVAPLQTAAASQLSFLANPRYRAAAAASSAGAIVLFRTGRGAWWPASAASGWSGWGPK